MIKTISDADGQSIDQAAALLDATGRSATHGSVAIRCLLAAELLIQAGAEVVSTDRGRTDDREALGQVLQLLGGLTEAALGDEHVLDAIHHALLAYAATR